MIMICISTISLEAHKRSENATGETDKLYGYLAIIFGISYFYIF